MSRETGGGGEPINSGEVDFDAVLAGVIKEKGDAAKQAVVKAETEKKSKSRRAEMAGELGGYLKDLGTKGGVESEQELVATAFNTLIYSEFNNKKISEAVQTKLDVYNEVRKKHIEATKKMANLPEDLQGDSRLQTALDKLKSDMVAQAKALASELGIKYEEIAKGETALLATEDVEIVRLREEADKLSPGKVEYAKENYEDYKKRIVGVLADRTTEIMQLKLEGLLLQNGQKESPGYMEKGNKFKQNVRSEDRDVIEKDEETVKKGVRLLTEKELLGLFEKIDASESNEGKRRAIIAKLEKRFGGLVDGASRIDENSNDNAIFLRFGEFDGETKNNMSHDLIIDVAFVESRIKFILESFCVNRNRRINVEPNNCSEEYMIYGRMSFLRHFKMDKENFSFEHFRGSDTDMIIRSSKKLDLDPKHNQDITDLAIKTGGIWEQVEKPYLLFGLNGVGNLSDTNSVPSVLFQEYAKIKNREKGLTNEQQKMRAQWNKELEKYMTGHEPTNQDVIDKATKPDGTVRLDKPETMKAMIAVFQERVKNVLEVAASKVEKIGELENTIYKLKQSLADLTHLNDRLSEELRTLQEQLRREEKQNQRLESQINLTHREIERVKEEKKVLRGLIEKAIEKLEAQKTKGIPTFGGAKEREERQNFINYIKQRAGI